MSLKENILIKNVTAFKSDGTTETTDILTRENKISKIGKIEFPDAFVIDGKNKFAIPGFVNAHTHSPMTLLRSYSDDKPLKSWLEEDIWPIEAKMTCQDIRIGAAAAAVEMIKSGTTTFADMYEPYMEEVAKIVESSGLRGVLSCGIIGIANGEKTLVDNVELFKNFNGAANGRIKIMFGPHAIYTCPPAFLKKVTKEAEKINAEIHIHMNETSREIEESLKTYGKRPFEVIDATGLFDLGALAAHCVHLTDNEIDIIRTKKIRVAHNPSSNMKLASGICPVSKLLQHGIIVGIGTDGTASNNNLDMLEEARITSFLAKVTTSDPLKIPAFQALQMATDYGAQAVGFKDVGKLEVGYKADIVLFNMNDITWLPNYDPLSLLIYSVNSSLVDTVIVDGKILMQGRELKTLDEEKIITEFKNCADRLTGRT